MKSRTGVFMRDYYQTELFNLRQLARDFAAAHPAVAPLLAAQGADPDVERLLEGTAYLCGFVQQRIDAGYPELVQALVRMIFHQLLLPIPSLSLVQFTPARGIGEALAVPAGTQLASVPVDGVSCLYSTVHPLDILPVDAGETAYVQLTASTSQLKLTLHPRAPLSLWWPDAIRFHLGGDYARASQRYLFLERHLESVEVRAGESVTRLPARNLCPVGFARQDSLLASTGSASRAYMFLREYYMFPQKFLFFDLAGLNRVRFSPEERRLDLIFNFRGAPQDAPSFPADSLLLNVTPVVNVFSQSAEPIVLDHTRREYRIRAAEAEDRGLSIVRIKSVRGIRPGGKIVNYQPYEAFSAAGPGHGVYTARSEKPQSDGAVETFISVVHGEGVPDFTEETLAVELECHNHSLPAKLRAGDICRPTDSSPAMAAFRNIVAPTASVPPVQDEGLLWRFLSHLHVNLLPLADVEALRSLVGLYVPENTLVPALTQGNRRRVESIRAFSCAPESRLFRGLAMRGNRIGIELDAKGFASMGDLYLFGTVLERFLANFSSINSYSRLIITETDSKETFQWAPRLGERQLL